MNQEQKEELQPKRKSIKRNYIYNVIYQVFLVVVPLVLTPYVSRVLLAEGVGKYSFAYSLITYFTIFGSLGFGYYAQREIAKYQGNQLQQSRIFWEINLCRLLSVGLALAVNIACCLGNLYGDYNSLMWIFNINIISLAFDIAFFFQGNEEFGKLVLRNVVIKILSIASILIFVKTPEHLGLYAIINSVMLIISNLAMWPSLRKSIRYVAVRELQPMRHLKGTLKLFVPTIATSIYTVLDKTLIGLLIQDTYTVIEDGVEIVKKFSDLENGYYEQSEKLVKMAMTVITCMGTVMIPRNSYEIMHGNQDKVKENIYFSSRLVWLLGIPMVFGLIAIAPNFVPWFYGDGYEKCITLLMIFSALILIIGLSNVFGLQYLVPMGNDKGFSLALIGGAAVNLVLNCILIPFFWSYGAAIASVIAELFVTVLMAIMIRKTISIKKILLSSWKYLLAGLAMFALTYFMGNWLSASILNTFLIVLAGIAVYGIFLILLREELVMKGIRKVWKRKNG